MSYCKWLRRSGIAGLILGLASVFGCGGDEPLPPAAGVPGRDGPAVPPGTLKQGAAKKGRAKSRSLEKGSRLRRRRLAQTESLPQPSENLGSSFPVVGPFRPGGPLLSMHRKTIREGVVRALAVRSDARCEFSPGGGCPTLGLTSPSFVCMKILFLVTRPAAAGTSVCETGQPDHDSRP